MKKICKSVNVSLKWPNDIFINKNGSNISHTGSWLGAVTYINRNLDTDAMFVLLESSASKYSYEIRKEVQRVLHNSKSHMFFTK